MVGNKEKSAKAEKEKVKKRGKPINKKGIFVVIFFGGILLTSLSVAALPPPPPTMTPEEVAMEEQGFTITNTPMDNFPDDQRDTFCGIGNPKSTSYVKEYQIPTVCTQPLAIKVAPDGNVWFVESNVGQIAKFDPISEQFTEFENDLWPEGSRTMSWGMDYSPDGKMWYTDGSFDSIWRFDTINEEYDASINTLLLKKVHYHKNLLFMVQI